MLEKTIKNLVIVESPAKAKTVARYLGNDFNVVSSIGHIRSIVKKPTKGVKAIDTDHNFETIYEIDPEKKKTVAELRKAVKNAQRVWIATDEDREGEAIAWHLCEVLKLNPATTNRIVFNEITKNAILTAIESPRNVDINLVKAQQARQILDRLVGFELSPVVWRKVPGGKSAGRVQSPAVRLLVEREREIINFEDSSNFKISAEFSKNNKGIKAVLSTSFSDEESAQKFLESLIDAQYSVASIDQTAGTRNPLPPFTTSTLQQDANAKLGFSARTTMNLAQQLYQSGFITYMRTDSMSLSGQALAQMSNYIKKELGDNYHQIRKFTTKSTGAQEAHEAIRPTDAAREVVGMDARAQKLYDLIRRRALASQMMSAKIERTTATIAISDHTETFTAKGEVVVFDGFLKMYGSTKDEILPELHEGDILNANAIIARQTFARPPARYSEGSLVKKLEELGIGRPSTYATIIDTIQTRGYVERGDSEGSERKVIQLQLKDQNINRDILTEKTGATKGKLVPTPSGSVVSDFLSEYFTDIVDYEFTARIESELDEIAENKLDKVKMLREFYDPFHKQIDNSADIERSAVAGMRELGIDPKTSEPIFVRMGRFGPMLQMGRGDDEIKPRFAAFPRNAKFETITLDQALKMFQLPRVVGLTENGEEIIANIGRFGPYIKIDKTFVSIKPQSPFEISEIEARELYAAKLKSDAEKNIADFGDIKILNGRFGPYITDGEKNVKIPKNTNPKKITEIEARKMLNDAPNKPKRKRYTRRKK